MSQYQENSYLFVLCQVALTQSYYGNLRHRLEWLALLLLLGIDVDREEWSCI